MHWEIKNGFELCPLTSQDNRAPKNGASIGSAPEGDGLEASIMAAITALTDEVWDVFSLGPAQHRLVEEGGIPCHCQWCNGFFDCRSTLTANN